MILRLNSEYGLRGWIGATCGLLHFVNNHVQFLKPVQFNLLLLCDGMTEIDDSFFSKSELEFLKEYMNAHIIEECSDISPLEKRQEFIQYDNRYVQSILWSVTGKCNFRCRHCYMDAPNGKLGEISQEEAISIIDQIAECGILKVSLTGGEVFVRPDIWKLIQHISEKGICIDQIYTNGWLVCEEVLEQLETLGQKPEFSFSFDCLGWHDWMRGINGAEKRVIQAIELCKKKGFKTSVEICTHKGSISTLAETIRLMGKYDTRVKVGSVMETELWKQNSEGYGFSRQEYYDAMIKYIDTFYKDGMSANVLIGDVIRLRKGSTNYSIIADKSATKEQCQDLHLCKAARMYAYITPEGRLVPCMPMTSWQGHTQFPKIQEVGLKKGLTDGFYMQIVNAKVNELFEKNNTCNTCEYKYRCLGGCRAIGLQDEGHLFGRDYGMCFFWKNGYVEKIRNAAEEAIQKYCKEKE